MRVKSSILRGASIASMIFLVLPIAAQAKGGAPNKGGNGSGLEQVVRLGTVKLSGVAGSSYSGSGQTAAEGKLPIEDPTDEAAPKTHTQPVHAGNVPNPKGTAITTVNPGFSGFNGISHLDQALAGTGIYANSQFSLEPPDQMLCTNGSQVMEGVNNALEVFGSGGNVLGPATAFSQFWQIAPEVYQPDASTPPSYGPFISDPKCYYDVATSRWFVSELEFDVDPSTGNFTGKSHQLIAVSETGDATGSYYLYSFATTDDGTDGTPSHNDCPCFGDQPLIGADANGFYVSTNEFPIFQNGFNGAQIFGLSKQMLESGATSIPLVHFEGGNIPGSAQYPGGTSYSVQPATVPTTNFETANNGTEYFLSSAEFTGDLDNRVIVWAMTNTADLASNPTAVSLSNDILGSETYGMGFNDFGVPQESGQRPLEQSLPGNSVPEELNANDDRMNQVVYADGYLWSGVNTLTIDQNGVNHVGVAYFIVKPSDPSGTLSATMQNQGYVSVNGNTNTFFPSIGVNDAGQGVLGFSLSGPSYFPSAGYVSISPSGTSGQIHLSAQGQLPDDGFTGYAAFGGNGIARWGDYSAAVAAPDGKSVWLANEYIPNAPRGYYANWGTFVSNVTL